MAYTVRNYRTKKELLADFKAGKEIIIFQPGPFGPNVRDGRIALEGPHYPEPHRWYAYGEVLDQRMVKIK